MGGVSLLPLGSLEVISQQRPIFGMSTIVDDVLGTLSRGKSPKIGHTLFSYQDVPIMFGMINMTDHWHDSRYRIMLGGRRNRKNG